MSWWAGLALKSVQPPDKGWSELEFCRALSSAPAIKRVIEVAGENFKKRAIDSSISILCG